MMNRRSCYLMTVCPPTPPTMKRRPESFFLVAALVFLYVAIMILMCALIKFILVFSPTLFSVYQTHTYTHTHTLSPLLSLFSSLLNRSIFYLRLWLSFTGCHLIEHCPQASWNVVKWQSPPVHRLQLATTIVNFTLSLVIFLLQLRLKIHPDRLELLCGDSPSLLQHQQKLNEYNLQNNDTLSLIIWGLKGGTSCEGSTAPYCYSIFLIFPPAYLLHYRCHARHVRFLTPCKQLHVMFARTH